MGKKRKKPLPPDVLDERVELRMSVKEKAAFQAAADRQGISLSHWIRLAARITIVDHKGEVRLIELK